MEQKDLSHYKQEVDLKKLAEAVLEARLKT